MSQRGQMIPKGDNKWLLRVYDGRDAEGKRHYTSKTYAGTTYEARQELTKMLRENDTETLVRPTKLTFSKFVEGWYKTKIDVSEQTKHDYEYRMKLYAIPALGGLKLHEITPQVVQNLYNDLKEKGLSPRSVRYVHVILHQAFEWAVEPMKLLVRNPTERLKLPKKVKRAPTFLSAEQIGKILEKNAEEPLYPLWYLQFNSGFRPQESLVLKWSDFEQTKDGCLATVRRTLVNDGHGNYDVKPTAKTDGSMRTVTISKSTWDVLVAHRRRQAAEMILAGERYNRQDYVFATRFGSPFDRPNVSKRWKTALKNAKITLKARFYDTRHSHATTLLNNGVDIGLVSKRLGHKSIQTTMSHYAFLLPETDQNMAETMEQAVSTAAKKAAAQ